MEVSHWCTLTCQKIWLQQAFHLLVPHLLESMLNVKFWTPVFFLLLDEVEKVSPVKLLIVDRRYVLIIASVIPK